MRVWKRIDAAGTEKRRAFETLRSAVVFAFVCFCVVGWLPSDREGNTVLAQPVSDKETGKYLGVASCQGCHDKGDKGSFSTDFVKMDEYVTWSKEDKHSMAHRVLTEELSQRMGKLLQQDVTKPAAGCINCHAMNSIPQERRSDNVKMEDGVSCDGCHGPAEKWLGEHILKDEWRKRPPEYKAAKGMLDIRNPITRTTMCLSCHVGNVGEGKVVTHEMYAAGHPPLPSFEVATFSNNLPPHWRKPRDVPWLKDAKPEIQKQYHYDLDESQDTKLVLLGGILALRETANMLADQAGKADWPELAMFDCYACHHELKTPSWRQERGYPGKPGRPGLRYWPLTIPSAALPLAGASSDEFSPRLKPLQAAFDAQPFGKPAEVAVAARDLAKHCHELVDRLARLKYDQAAAQIALISLTNQARLETFDFDSARQAAWSFRVIHNELSPKSARDAEIQAAFATLEKELRLALPSGREHKILEWGTLQTMANYDAARFRRQMDALHKLISK